MDYYHSQLEHTNYGLSQCDNQIYISSKIYYGQFQSRSCRYKDRLQVYGDALLYNTQVFDAYIYGHAVLRNQTDISSLRVYSDRVYINQSVVGDLYISSKRQPIVYFNNSKITGTLVFTECKGKVYQDNFSSISQMSNGEIIHV